MKPGSRSVGPASCHIKFSQVVDVTKRGLVRELTDMQTSSEWRGCGYASQLLKAVCAEADKADIMLIVRVEPYGETGLDTQEATLWYARHGFKAIQQGPVVMMRPAHVHPGHQEVRDDIERSLPVKAKPPAITPSSLLREWAEASRDELNRCFFGKEDGYDPRIKLPSEYRKAPR